MCSHHPDHHSGIPLKVSRHLWSTLKSYLGSAWGRLTTAAARWQCSRRLVKKHLWRTKAHLLLFSRLKMLVTVYILSNTWVFVYISLVILQLTSFMTSSCFHLGFSSSMTAGGRSEAVVWCRLCLCVPGNPPLLYQKSSINLGCSSFERRLNLEAWRSQFHRCIK